MKFMSITKHKNYYNLFKPTCPLRQIDVDQFLLVRARVGVGAVTGPLHREGRALSLHARTTAGQRHAHATGKLFGSFKRCDIRKHTQDNMK